MEIWTDHLWKLDLTLNKLKVDGLKCIIKDFFFQIDMKYLVFLVMRQIAIPTYIKFGIIVNMNHPVYKWNIINFIIQVHY